jgi:thiol:disulfide interchange protein DsbD
MKKSPGTVWVAVFVVFSILGLAPAAQAKPWWLRGVDTNETDFLPPDVAFRIGARVDGNVVRVRWVIADGYYLYRSKIAVQAESPDLLVAAPQLPPGALKTDPYLGTQRIYTQQVEAVVPYSRLDAGAHPLQIKVTYQGCAEAGLCYPPITKVLFPTVGSPAGGVAEPSSPFESTAIIAGACAFLLAGLVLRKGRKLDIPA